MPSPVIRSHLTQIQLVVVETGAVVKECRFRGEIASYCWQSKDKVIHILNHFITTTHVE